MPEEDHRYTIGLVKYLETRRDVCDVQVLREDPATMDKIKDWEEDQSCLLPGDLRDFYLTMNGITVTWNVKQKDGSTPVGGISINSLERLQRLRVQSSSRLVSDSFVQQILSEGTLEAEGRSRPTLNPHHQVFELETCAEGHHVCLVYGAATAVTAAVTAAAAASNPTGPTVWLLDRSLVWYYICDSFSLYYRLSLSHLGLPQWQLSYTGAGINQHAAKWLQTFNPFSSSHSVTTSGKSVQLSGPADEAFEESLAALPSYDADKVFERKKEKKKPAPLTHQTSTQLFSRKPPAGNKTRSSSLRKPVPHNTSSQKS